MSVQNMGCEKYFLNILKIKKCISNVFFLNKLYRKLSLDFSYIIKIQVVFYSGKQSIL